MGTGFMRKASRAVRGSFHLCSEQRLWYMLGQLSILAHDMEAEGMAKKSGGNGHYRSAITGRYVTTAHGKRSPNTTVYEKTGGGATGSARSAKTGRFVTEGFAKRNPRTTVKED